MTCSAHARLQLLQKILLAENVSDKPSLTSLAFTTSIASPNYYSLVTANIDGDVHICPDVVSKEKVVPVVAGETKDKVGNATAITKKKKKPRAILDDDDDDDNDATTNDMQVEESDEATTHKREDASATDSVNVAKKQLGFDDEADEEEVDEAKEAEKLLNAKGHDGGDDDDDNEEDDFDAPNAARNEKVVPLERAVAEVLNEMELLMQHPFQPSCTAGIRFPTGGESSHHQHQHQHLARRWLCWNLTGTIASRQEESHCSVDVEFSDATKGRSIRIVDKYFFTMAALSRKGAIFASPKRDAAPGQEFDASTRKAVPSTIFYRPFVSWQMGTGEWDVALPAGEEALGVAIGDDWAAVATASPQHMLRLFRPSGLQDAPCMLPGPLVTMAGHGDLLGVVYHRGATFGSNHQCLGYSVFRICGPGGGGGVGGGGGGGAVVSSFAQISHGVVPLGPDAKLRWAGFTELGMFSVADSDGFLLGLEDRNQLWVPLLRLHLTDAQSQYWMIGVVADKVGGALTLTP